MESIRQTVLHDSKELEEWIVAWLHFHFIACYEVGTWDTLVGQSLGPEKGHVLSIAPLAISSLMSFGERPST